MTEAVNCIAQFAFASLMAVRLEIRCDIANHASAAVAKRAGFALESRMRCHRRNMSGELTDTLVFVRFPHD